MVRLLKQHQLRSKYRLQRTSCSRCIPRRPSVGARCQGRTRAGGLQQEQQKAWMQHVKPRYAVCNDNDRSVVHQTRRFSSSRCAIIHEHRCPSCNAPSCLAWRSGMAALMALQPPSSRMAASQHGRGRKCWCRVAVRTSQTQYQHENSRKGCNGSEPRQRTHKHPPLVLKLVWRPHPSCVSTGLGSNVTFRPYCRVVDTCMTLVMKSGQPIIAS